MGNYLTAGAALLFVAVLVYVLMRVSDTMRRRRGIAGSLEEAAQREFDRQLMDERERIFVLLRERYNIERAIPSYFRPDLPYEKRVVAALDEWRERCL